MTVSELQERIEALEANMAKVLERLEHQETIASIYRGLHQFETGQFKSAKQAFEEIRTKHNIPRT